MLSKEKEELRAAIEAQHAKKAEELQQQYQKEKEQWTNQSQIIRQELEQERKQAALNAERQRALEMARV